MNNEVNACLRALESSIKKNSLDLTYLQCGHRLMCLGISSFTENNHATISHDLEKLVWDYMKKEWSK